MCQSGFKPVIPRFLLSMTTATSSDIQPVNVVFSNSNAVTKVDEQEKYVAWYCSVTTYEWLAEIKIKSNRDVGTDMHWAHRPSHNRVPLIRWILSLHEDRFH
jgi:hypothetical protein